MFASRQTSISESEPIIIMTNPDFNPSGKSGLIFYYKAEKVDSPRGDYRYTQLKSPSMTDIKLINNEPDIFYGNDNLLIPKADAQYAEYVKYTPQSTFSNICKGLNRFSNRGGRVMRKNRKTNHRKIKKTKRKHTKKMRRR